MSTVPVSSFTLTSRNCGDTFPHRARLTDSRTSVRLVMVSPTCMGLYSESSQEHSVLQLPHLPQPSPRAREFCPRLPVGHSRVCDALCRSIVIVRKPKKVHPPPPRHALEQGVPSAGIVVHRKPARPDIHRG